MTYPMTCEIIGGYRDGELIHTPSSAKFATFHIKTDEGIKQLKCPIRDNKIFWNEGTI